MTADFEHVDALLARVGAPIAATPHADAGLESDSVTGPEPHWPHRVPIAPFADDPWVYDLL